MLLDNSDIWFSSFDGLELMFSDENKILLMFSVKLLSLKELKELTKLKLKFSAIDETSVLRILVGKWNKWLIIPDWEAGIVRASLNNTSKLLKE